MKRWATKKLRAATIPAPGKVRTHAATMLPATPQRTADRRLVAPTPMIEEVIVWVVEIGALKPRPATNSTAEADASAAKPCGGSRWMMRRPSVRMIRHPPEYVPRLMTRALETLTHSGIEEPEW